MNRRSFTCTLVLLVCLPMFGACSEHPSPMAITQHFWVAVQGRNPDEIQRYVLGANDVPDAILSISDVRLGETLIKGDKAWVDTTLVVSSEKPSTIALSTVLAREAGRWKIDYDTTVDSIRRREEFVQLLQNMREALCKGLDESLEQFEKVLPAIEREMAQLEQKLKGEAPELRKRFEAFSRKLEELIEDWPAKKPEPIRPIEI